MLAVWQGGVGNGNANIYYSYGYYTDDGSLIWSDAKQLTENDANYANVLAYASEESGLNQQGQSEFYVVAHRKNVEAGNQTNNITTNNLVTTNVLTASDTTPPSTNNTDDTDVYFSKKGLSSEDAVSLNTSNTSSTNPIQTSTPDSTSTAPVAVATSTSSGTSSTSSSGGFMRNHTQESASLTVKIPLKLPFSIVNMLSGVHEGQLLNELEIFKSDSNDIFYAGLDDAVAGKDFSPKEVEKMVIEYEKKQEDSLARIRRGLAPTYLVIELSSEMGRAINDNNDINGTSKYRTKVKVGIETERRQLQNASEEEEFNNPYLNNQESPRIFGAGEPQLIERSLSGETTYYFDNDGNFYQQGISDTLGLTYLLLGDSVPIEEIDGEFILAVTTPGTLSFDSVLIPENGTKAPLDLSFGHNNADDVVQWDGAGLLAALAEAIPILNGATNALSATKGYSYDPNDPPQIGVSIDPTVKATVEAGRIPILGPILSVSAAGDIYGGIYFPLSGGTQNWQPSSLFILDLNLTFGVSILGLLSASFTLSTGDLIPHSNSNESTSSLATQSLAINAEPQSVNTQTIVTNPSVTYPGTSVTTVSNAPLTGTTNNNYSQDFSLIAANNGESDRANDYPIKIYIPQNGNAIGIWATDNEYTNADGTINTAQPVGTIIRTQSFFGSSLSSPIDVTNDGINVDPVLGFYQVSNNNYNQIAIWSHADSSNLTLNSSLEDIQNALANSDLYYV